MSNVQIDIAKFKLVQFKIFISSYSQSSSQNYKIYQLPKLVYVYILLSDKMYTGKDYLGNTALCYV